MKQEQSILMSFDVEEFDMPLEYGDPIDPADQLTTGYDGLVKIKELLSAMDISVTLFTTAHFAENFPGIIRELSGSNEIASHTYYHSSFEIAHLAASRIMLEKIAGKKISGLRMPRMKKISTADVISAGYSYDSSLNPIWLPGRYNNLNKPRRAFMEDGLVKIPASVSTFLRIPLFWLSFKNMPYSFFLKLARTAIKKDGYACLYFHPWEFVELGRFRMPGYTKKPCGDILLEKLHRLIRDLKKEGQFITMDNYVERYRLHSGKA